MHRSAGGGGGMAAGAAAAAAAAAAAGSRHTAASLDLDHHHHHHHHHHANATAAATAFPWSAMLAGHAATGMMQPSASGHHDYSPTPAHHANTQHPAMPMDLHVSHQAFPYYRYRDEALCWTDRKPSMDDVANPNSVNARYDERHYAFESILELRKEKSRDAARSRRGKENFEFYELAKMLPLPAAITSQLDKASIIRLTISYLKLRDFSGHGDPPWSRDTPPPNKTLKGANRVRSSESLAADMFEQHQGTHILQSLDGFAVAVAADGRFLYISETVSIYLGLSQVEMTGSSIFDYVHQHDHAEVAEQLGLGLTSSSSGPHSSSSGLASPSSGASEDHVSSVMALTSTGLYKGYDRAFCVRMKSTLTKRGCHFKSSGYRVVLLLCRLRPQYTFSHTRKSSPPLVGMVGLAIALPPPSVHEIRLEADMFVTRINFDFRIAHCEPKVSELLDYTADELTGKNLYTLCHGEDANRLRKSHMDLIHKGQVLTHYYRLMNKSGGYTWLQTCATVVCNSKNAEEQNIICVNYVISGREYANLIMDCCQLEDGVTGVKREDATGNDPENGSPDADRGGRSSGGPTNPHSDHPHRSPRDDRDDARGSETDVAGRGVRHHDNVVTQLQQEPQTTTAKLRGRKRKLAVAAAVAIVNDVEVGSDDEDDEDETGIKNGRSHALSPASSNHSVPTNDQLMRTGSPKVRRTEDLSESHHGASTSGTGTSVKDLEQAMSKHLPGAGLNKADSPAIHQPTDFSTDALLKQQQQKSTIQWIGAHHHLGHLSPQQSSTLPASALLRQLYANRESVIRANVHGITSGSGPGSRAPSAGGYYPDNPQAGPLPTPPGSEGSSTYGDHQFVLSAHNQKVTGSGADAFTSLVSSYTSPAGYGVDYHSAMTPPSSVSPRDKQQQQQQVQQQQQQQAQLNTYDAVYGDPVMRHQYEPAQPLPLKPQVYSAVPLDAYATASLTEQSQFYHHPAASAGFHLYHPTANKTATNGWYSSAS
ncbi:protein trachealess isoform X2 [Phymastichus coffea]|uniref:protein trachealess isoform X2 n=1 Tax=Phymastichus coffea TaxID=108790 RepID=UPI00273C0ADD|nr:protein trachealess isoform X2 [Phymastichus coffea]